MMCNDAGESLQFVKRRPMVAGGHEFGRTATERKKGHRHYDRTEKGSVRKRHRRPLTQLRESSECPNMPTRITTAPVSAPASGCRSRA